MRRGLIIYRKCINFAFSVFNCMIWLIMRLKIFYAVIVDERHIPDPPTNIQVESEELDKRIGFFGHVVLNVSWDGPQSSNNK